MLLLKFHPGFPSQDFPLSPADMHAISLDQNLVDSLLSIILNLVFSLPRICIKVQFNFIQIIIIFLIFLNMTLSLL